MRPIRICFVGLKCYDLLADAPRPRYFGGAERQQVLLARALAARGHAVSVVTLDEGQPDGVVHDGVRVLKAYARSAGVPGVRFLHPRWSGLWAALGRADADLVCQMGGDSETGQVASWCGRRGRAFVFSVASDADADPVLPLLGSRRQRVLYRAGLRRADAVVAQTEAQRARLHASYGVDATLIRSCTADPGFDGGVVDRRTRNRRPQLLWVGRFVPVKRLELFLDLAEARPGWDFHVVGSGDAGTDYVRRLEARAGAQPNVRRHRDVSDDDLNDLYLAANALVCTSSLEGVPTTFLEAWARGLPVVSSVDPDGVIARHGLGAAPPADKLGAAIDATLGEPHDAVAWRVRQYYLATHSVEASIARHEHLFRAVLAARAGRPAAPAAAGAPMTGRAAPPVPPGPSPRR